MALCLTQPGTLLTNLSPGNAVGHQDPGPFLWCCLPASSPTAYTGTWDCSSFELDEVLLCPFFQPVKVPVNGGTIIWRLPHSSQFCIFCRLAEVVHSPISLISNGDIKYLDPVPSSGNTISDWPPAGLCHWPQPAELGSSASVQPTSLPPHLVYNSPVSLNMLWERTWKAVLKSKETSTALPSAGGSFPCWDVCQAWLCVHCLLLITFLPFMCFQIAVSALPWW